MQSRLCSCRTRQCSLLVALQQSNAGSAVSRIRAESRLPLYPCKAPLTLDQLHEVLVLRWQAAQLQPGLQDSTA